VEIQASRLIVCHAFLALQKRSECIKMAYWGGEDPVRARLGWCATRLLGQIRTRPHQSRVRDCIARAGRYRAPPFICSGPIHQSNRQDMWLRGRLSNPAFDH
jgi:hypothetical protein